MHAASREPQSSDALQQSGQLLLRHLDEQRETLLWKLEGLGEAALRQPVSAVTGTNLLGLVKHLTAVEYGYFQMPFGRPHPDLPHLRPDADGMLDFYATADERAEQILAEYRDAVQASRQTCAELPLDAQGQVPWWNEPTTLLHLVVHVTVETARHLGHADIVREQLDGSVGRAPGNDNLWASGEQFWEEHRTMLRTLAKQAELGALETSNETADEGTPNPAVERR